MIPVPKLIMPKMEDMIELNNALKNISKITRELCEK